MLADLAYEQTRTAISGLHSLVLGDLGLSAALESLATMATGDHAPTLDLLVDPDESFRDVPDHAAAALFRIAQEAIGNAVKHAQADRIVLSLRRVGDSVVLGCTDDGVGFDPAERRTQRGDDHAQHFGLSSIAERCALVEAALRVESMPGRGTTLLVELPIQGERPARATSGAALASRFSAGTTRRVRSCSGVPVAPRGPGGPLLPRRPARR